jgi:hypothetical protein
MNLIEITIIVLFFSILFPNNKFKTVSSLQNQAIEWLPADLIYASNSDIRITGNPKTIDCKYGKALSFNGSTDGLFLSQMPLSGLNQFTIEAIVRPESGGNFEQRFFHCGEIQGSRLLLELRSTQTDWYFDAFIKSGDQQKTLIDPNLLHPLDQWYHLAFVVNGGKLTTYINEKKELEGEIVLAPLQGGKTSIGVRLNEQSWFKGEIYKIRITPKVLNPSDFLVL